MILTNLGVFWRTIRVGFVLFIAYYVIEGLIQDPLGVTSWPILFFGYELDQIPAIVTRNTGALPVIFLLLLSNWTGLSRRARWWHAIAATALAGLDVLHDISVLQGVTAIDPSSVLHRGSLIVGAQLGQFALLARAGGLVGLDGRWGLSRPEPPATPSFSDLIGADDQDRLVRVASLLHSESDRMRRLSIQTLIIVGALIALASVVVLFAGYITSIDLRGASPVQKAESYLSSARSAEGDAQKAVSDLRFFSTRLQELERSLADLDLKLSEIEEKAANGQPFDAAQKLELQREREASRITLDTMLARVPARSVASMNADLKDAEATLVERRGDAKRAQDLLERARALDVLETRTVTAEDGSTTEVPVTTGANTTEALVAAGVTRFGIVLLIIFLAQALINLYRYSLRLSAFYRARAVILVLSKGDPSQMEQAAKSLSPDHLSLGREPKTPLQDIKDVAELAKSLR